MTSDEVKIKHAKLKELDRTNRIFGSDRHKYKLNPPISTEYLTKFEKQHNVTLPSEYKNFLLQVGNGGSGPAYGLFPLEKWADELQIEDCHFLATNFPHLGDWNLSCDLDLNDEKIYGDPAYQVWENDYYANQHVTGSIRICHYGCAIFYMLIITGQEAGNIWVDDRANCLGIYPAISPQSKQSMTFLEWYFDWLEESLSKLT